MTSKDDNKEIHNILVEFCEVAIHTILYIRKLYPEGIFVRRKKYGTVVYQSLFPDVTEYITQTLKAVKFHAKNRQLKKLSLCIISSKTTLERYVFEVFPLESTTDDDPFFIKLEQSFRDVFIRLQTSCGYLEPLPEDATFRIQLHVTESSSAEFNATPKFEDFPWLHVHSSKGEPLAAVVPVQTVDIKSTCLQIYLERNLSD